MGDQAGRQAVSCAGGQERAVGRPLGGRSASSVGAGSRGNRGIPARQAATVAWAKFLKRLRDSCLSFSLGLIAARCSFTNDQ